MILAALLAACGTAAGWTGSTRPGEASIAGDRGLVNVPNAASNVITSRTHDSADRAASKAATPPTAQTIAPRTNAVPPTDRASCGPDSGFGKGRPMCAPE